MMETEENHVPPRQDIEVKLSQRTYVLFIKYVVSDIPCEKFNH